MRRAPPRTQAAARRARELARDAARARAEAAPKGLGPSARGGGWGAATGRSNASGPPPPGALRAPLPPAPTGRSPARAHGPAPDCQSAAAAASTAAAARRAAAAAAVAMRASWAVRSRRLRRRTCRKVRPAGPGEVRAGPAHGEGGKGGEGAARSAAVAGERATAQRLSDRRRGARGTTGVVALGPGRCVGRAGSIRAAGGGRWGVR